MYLWFSAYLEETVWMDGEVSVSYGPWNSAQRGVPGNFFQY